MNRLIGLNVTVDDILQADHVWVSLERVSRDLFRSGYDVSLHMHKMGKDSEDDLGAEDDSKKTLTWQVHTILCRLGMTETEAWTAITEIHEADIIFAKKDSIPEDEAPSDTNLANKLYEYSKSLPNLKSAAVEFDMHKDRFVIPIDESVEEEQSGTVIRNVYTEHEIRVSEKTCLNPDHVEHVMTDTPCVFNYEDGPCKVVDHYVHVEPK